jgi:hypothetical protein
MHFLGLNINLLKEIQKLLIYFENSKKCVYLIDKAWKNIQQSIWKNIQQSICKHKELMACSVLFALELMWKIHYHLYTCVHVQVCN